MKLTEINSWPPNSNPMEMDRYHIGEGWMILHAHHPSGEFQYSIWVHIPSGRRWRLEVDESLRGPMSALALSASGIGKES